MSGWFEGFAHEVWAAAAPRAVHLLALGALALAIDAGARRSRWSLLRAASWWLVPLAATMPAGTAFGGGGVATAAAATLDVVAAVPDVATWILVVWAVGAAWAAACTMRAHVCARGLLLQSSSSDLPDALRAAVADCARRIGLRRAPAVRVLDGRAGPAVVGVLRPIVVVPRSALEDERRLRCALLHEMAHVVRRDPWQAAVVRAVRIVWWFHPALGWAETRLAELRELAADARAARVMGKDAGAYRDALLETARDWVEVPAPALGFLSPRPGLLVRLAALERLGREPGRARRGLAALSFCAAAWACVPIPRVPEPTTDLAELQGCLQLRYAVLGAMRAEASN